NSWLGYGFAGDKPPRYEVFRCYLWLTPMPPSPPLLESSLSGYVHLYLIISTCEIRPARDARGRPKVKQHGAIDGAVV
ncbi:MAG: hypothetical protein JXA30_18290, partial [Deltaproteobacteria bacterium]|nr:hypothetical protein [Deltaproteobacteria bacterium]